jgi:2-methylisocitrate lyase-like PEP mutase family enzyme
MPAEMTHARRLRQLLEGDAIVMAPGVFSPIVARLVAEAGFPACYLSGAGIAAGMYGQPDVGLVTQTETVNAARYCVDTGAIPVICDADTGFGNPLNIQRTVRDLENAGVAALHIEDQAFPKKCGFFEGHTLISSEEMVQNIRAALDARGDPDTLIIARTERKPARDLDESIARARAYREAGADMTFVNGVTRVEDVERIAREVPGPHLYNVSSSGQTPHLHTDRLRELGFRIVIYPAHALFFALHGIQAMLGDLRKSGTIEPWLDRMISFGEWQRLTRVPETEALERRYGSGRGKETVDDEP